MSRSSTRATGQHGGYSAAKLSPGALERRMMAELHLMDGMEESLRQLTDVERSRAVTMAQQESVSLAQILKVGQQDCLK